MSHHETLEIPAQGTWRAITPAGAQALGTVAADPDGTLLVSDFDGTLAPIVPNPEDSRLDPRSGEAFAGLARRVGKVAMVTGREAEVARRLGGFEQLEGFESLVLLGQYGLEEWDASTGEVRVPEAPQSVREALAELADLLADPRLPDFCAGAHLEDKGRAIGVHTRRAADPAACLSWLQAPLAEVANRHGLVLEPGRNVVELRSSSVNKGDAIRTLVERFRPRVVVMMGDDLGDLAAFEAVESLSAQGIVGIRVVAGSAEQPVVARQADVLCGGPEGVASWMEDLLAALPSTSEDSR